jgi:hypothetical protein
MQVTPIKLSKLISRPKIPNANQMLISYFPHITISNTTGMTHLKLQTVSPLHIHNSIKTMEILYVYNQGVHPIVLYKTHLPPMPHPPTKEPGPPHYWDFTITLLTPHSLGLLWRVISPILRSLPEKTQHSRAAYFYAPGGVWTRNPNKRECAWLLESAVIIF